MQHFFLKNLQNVCFREEISSAAEGKSPTDEKKTTRCLRGGRAHQQYQGLC